MTSGRLQAFSDGVIAIIITIMVLEMKVPHGDSLEELRPLVPVFLSYVLSFVYVGIYWNNHHHMLHACSVVTGAILWANLHLLFWLSLFPFATGRMGQNHFTAAPTALYGVVLLMAAMAYLVLQQTIIRAQGQDSILKKAIGRDWKGKLSPVLYITAIVATLRSPWIAQAIFVIAALIWLIRTGVLKNVLSCNWACAPKTSLHVRVSSFSSVNIATIHWNISASGHPLIAFREITEQSGALSSRANETSCHKTLGCSVLASTTGRCEMRRSTMKGDNHENRSDRRYRTHWIKACQQAA
jgi:uncharacterized membrane protein